MRRRSDDPWITRMKSKPRVSRTVGAAHFAPSAPTLRGLRAHAGRRALGAGGIAGEPRDAAEVDGEGQFVAPTRATRKDHPCVAGAESQFWRVGDAGLLSVSLVGGERSG